MQTIQIRLTKELLKKAQELVNRGLYSNKSEVLRDSLRRLCFPEMNTSERMFQIIYSSDLHGNIVQYKKLFSRAIQIKADAIILGGDLLPKDKKNRTPKKQKEFFEKKLLSLLEQFHKQNKKNCKVFLMLGNDDFKMSLNLLQKNEKKGHYQVIHNKCLKLHEGFKIIGYSYVPLTPFIHKDWEKLDLNEENEMQVREDIVLKGDINSHSQKKFDLKNRKDTIEKDLNRLLNKSHPRKTILVTHSPPYNTSLDMISAKKHVGSRAVKKIIENNQPLVSLHGHIHETIEFSGKFMEDIESSLSMSPGNDHIGKDLAIIEFNLYCPKKAKRILL